VARAHARFAFALATPADDPDIRRLLRDTAFPGAVSLSLEREPDSSIAARVEGAVHDTIVARDRASNALAAAASRCVRTRFVNGVEARVGYLGQLRIAAPFSRARGLLEGGFEFCRALHDRGDARIYLASVVQENAGALRLLERGIAGSPTFRAVDRLVTLAIPVRRLPAFRAPEVGIVGGVDCDPAAVIQCLRRTCREHQFAPCWTIADLAHRLPGLSRSDLFVAIKDGEVAGCVALWDQRAFKQARVRGYSASLRRSRWAINAAARLMGTVRLPPVGSRLEFAYLSHLAADRADPAVLLSLVHAACARANEHGLQYVAVGLSARSADLDAIRRTFRSRAYVSVLYAGAWPDGAEMLDSLDGRPCNPELALL
jgi:hypothetical protein